MGQKSRPIGRDLNFSRKYKLPVLSKKDIDFRGVIEGPR